jgi:hypothetical protein
LYVGQNREGNEDQRRLFKEVVKKLFSIRGVPIHSLDAARCIIDLRGCNGIRQSWLDWP